MTTPRAVGGITLQGVDDLRHQLDPAVFNRTMRIAHRRGVARVQRESRAIAPGIIFDRSIRSQVLPGGLGGIVYTDARAAESIHEGRPIGNAPTIRALMRWVRTNGLAGSVSLKTRRVRRAKSAQGAESVVRAMAVRFQQTIRDRGTKAIPFLAGALAPSRADVERYWAEALADTVKHFAGRRKVA